MRYRSEGLNIVIVDRGFWSETYASGFITGTGALNSGQVSVLGGLLDDRSAAHIRLFGGDPGLPKELAGGLHSEKIGIDRFEQPVTKVTPSIGLKAFIVRANSAAELKFIRFEGNSSGFIVEAPDALMGYLSGVKSPLPSEREAFKETYEQTILQLLKMGFKATDLTRTWCYFRDISAEYKAFNEIRKKLLNQYGMLDSILPASTGIQGVIDSGEHLTMDALAFAGPQPKRERVSNPSQCEAEQYGSFFSRGILVQNLGPTQLIVSGLAAVGERGESMCPNDPVAQVDATIRNAEDILGRCGFNPQDIASGIIYIKPKYRREIDGKLPDTPIDELPFSRAYADVCRPDLFFEIEFMAFKS